MEISPDFPAVGDGPVGCVTALACAQGGARVLLLEAQAQATSRMAGEWLHPSGVGVCIEDKLFPKTNSFRKGTASAFYL